MTEVQDRPMDACPLCGQKPCEPDCYNALLKAASDEHLAASERSPGKDRDGTVGDDLSDGGEPPTEGETVPEAEWQERRDLK